MTHTHLDLVSTSLAGDASFLAAQDLSDVASELDIAYRLVGGNAVTLLTAVHNVTDRAPVRETADADFGAPYSVVADPRLPQALARRGYRQVAGNRFTRTHLVTTDGTSADTRNLVIDVLAPSFHGRLVPGQVFGSLVVDEVPGLHLALARPGTQVTVRVRLTSGHQMQTHLVLPDVVSALCLKAHAFVGRFSDRDAVDLWRLLETAENSGITSDTWPTGPTTTETARILRQHFGKPGARGPARASARSRDRARIRALVRHVVGL